MAKIDHNKTKNITKLNSPKNCNVQDLLACCIFISQFLFQNWPGHCEELWGLLS